MTVLDNITIMAALKSWMFLATISLSHISWSAAASTSQKSDTDDGQVGASGALGQLPELVFKVQQIYIKYNCAYQDPDGVCSPASKPDCSEVKSSGVCVLNSCEKQSEADRVKVAGLLAQIAEATYDCGLTGDNILNAANHAPRIVHIPIWITTLIASAFGILITTRLRLALW